MPECFSRVADGNITPFTFVKLSTTVQGRVVQAASHTDKLFGVSQPGTRNPSSSLFNDDGFAAIQGENVGIFGPPQVGVMLKLGGTVTRGDQLTSDGSGQGITTTTTADWVGAIALDSGVANDIIPVQLVAYVL